MNSSKKYVNSNFLAISLFGLFIMAITLGSFLVTISLLNVKELTALALSLIIGLLTVGFGSIKLGKILAQPALHISETLDHLTSDEPLELHPQSDLLGEGLNEHVTQKITQFINQQHILSAKTQSKADQFSRILDGISHPIVAVNSQQQVIFCNHALSSFLDKPTSEIVGRSIDEVMPLTREGERFIPSWIQLMQSSVVNKHDDWKGVMYISPNHQIYNLQVTASFNRNEHEEGLESVFLLIDRTQEHEFDNMRVDMAAMAAHELRGPVTVIRGYVDVLEEELEEKLSDDQKRILEKLQVSSSQLASFISTILHASKVDKGTQQFHFEKHNWSSFLLQVLTDLKLQAKARELKLEINIDENMPDVAIDPLSLTEVIVNLVQNAIKYSRGKDKIVISSRVDEDGLVETTIQDFGVGIPVNLMDKLFTRFYRSHRTKHSYEGSGLGLYLSKAIIDGHQGKIWAKSTEGQGSTFAFTLPQYDQVIDTLESGGKSSVTRGHHGWIKNHSLSRKS